MTLTVRVIAPDRTVWDENADEVILPSTTGQVGILTGHAPLLTALDTGVLRVRSKNKWTPIALMGGFAEVEANEVTILVNGAERGDTINLEVARTAYTKAQADLEVAETSDSKKAKIKATKAIKRARARLQAAGGVIE
ncbi:F0F1 ATP synthase subunit epsilon [Planktothrix agardhii 1029]|jgi:F-type H+-transporting ATPase subunit epsilon|uniref:ATP synthase F1 subunit epsilon n=1 Tax=Planktothrix agardhii TaxID=1160 RepID=UPI001D09B7DB|nr:ATP synthase F1 subunit epsilon [Planktothrix agardhii]MCB8765463.1 F0F1 ATP synthase subunit epsilon [Planktothrix agardhii 1809]MCB8779099.1 F0F1 ATP synthase subunit epsilon [Planktothrix agardhii 1031]MCB8783516.1 F0F1 ATP synthase subunit epsilon [Planktothrix agardhii 1808]MCF3565457.1 F0F1 ATP synthase subunit epsilon [Planktothrix agardhii 1807]MCF3592027.1 F0F1 ATP synthase subunit epsilon [Planktothrix agardhii 1029]